MTASVPSAGDGEGDADALYQAAIDLAKGAAAAALWASVTRDTFGSPQQMARQLSAETGIAPDAALATLRQLGKLLDTMYIHLSQVNDAAARYAGLIDVGFIRPIRDARASNRSTSSTRGLGVST